MEKKNRSFVGLAQSQPTHYFPQELISSRGNLSSPLSYRNLYSLKIYIIRRAVKNLAPVVACRPPENCIYDYT